MSAHSHLLMLVFCAGVAEVGYVYFGYPLFLWLGAFGRRKSFVTAPIQPSVTIIVAAHNEEASIETKINDLLALDYPRDKIELLIGSDGSSDRTEDIVRGFERDGVGLVSFPRQHGKSAIQNSLVAHAGGDILVFTDADCLVPPAALSQLVEHFADSRVGLVTACPHFRNQSDSAITGNESLYLRYETWLRWRESDLGLLAMASGALFAVRRSLWQPLSPNLGEDFVLPMRVLRQGFVNLLDPRVIAFTELSQSSPRAMLRMKIRIIAKDFRALLVNRDLLNPFRYGIAAFALCSHKLLRWLVPYFLFAILASNALLLAYLQFRVLFAFQVAFYLSALFGLVEGGRKLYFAWSVPMSFCLVNFAALIGTLRAVAGRPSGAWKPDRRSTQSPDIGSPAPSHVIK